MTTFCLAKIKSGRRTGFLDELLKLLNETGSPQIAEAIEKVLPGPDAFAIKEEDGGRVDDYLGWLSRTTSFNFVENMALTKHGQRSYQMRQDLVRLARTPAASHWPELHELAERKEQGDFFVAAAQAMHAADPAKTCEWLMASLRATTVDVDKAAPILRAMGVIADDAFLPEVEAFGKTSAIYNSAEIYRTAFQYALYRCNGEHRRRLVKDSTGRWAIEKMVLGMEK